MGFQRAYRSGALAGHIYEFDSGDKIPTHKHDKEHLHNVIVLSGSVCIQGDNGVSCLLLAGEVYDFDGSEPHEIVAQEHSVTLNLFLNGAPSDFDENYKGPF